MVGFIVQILGRLNSATQAEHASIRLLMEQGRFHQAQVTLESHCSRYEQMGCVRISGANCVINVELLLFPLLLVLGTCPTFFHKLLQCTLCRCRKLALYCRVLSAQCALHVYQQQYRRATRHSRTEIEFSDVTDNLQTTTSNADSSTKASDQNATSDILPSRRRPRPSRSSHGSGTAHAAYQEAMWAVLDVLVCLFVAASV